MFYSFSYASSNTSQCYVHPHVARSMLFVNSLEKTHQKSPISHKSHKAEKHLSEHSDEVMKQQQIALYPLPLSEFAAV